MSANNNTYQLIELDADAGWTLVLLNADGSEHGRSAYPAREFAERAALDSLRLIPAFWATR